MSFERTHQDLEVVLTRNREGRIVKADLVQDNPLPSMREPDQVQLNAFQLYALVDDVAVADPEGWARRFDPRDPIERHLRQVADKLKKRSEVNRRAAAGSTTSGRRHYSTMADTFDLAVTTIMEEIEGLYAGEIDPTQAVNDNLNRRS